MGACNIIVIDFETTGLSPHYGDRTIEVGAVHVANNRIVDQYQSLMNPEVRISNFIADYTGITNKMLSKAPKIKEVMEQLRSFIGHLPLVAHNASFDSRFLDSEMDRLNHKRDNEFACSMLTARRLYPDAPNHKLETLVQYKRIVTDGTHHRALADATMTAHLWINMITDIKEMYELPEVPFTLMQRLGKVPKKKVAEFMAKFRT